MHHSRELHKPAARQSSREEDDNYVGLLMQLGHRWRLIIDAEHIQWIVQFNKSRSASPQWRAKKFFTTRTALEAFLCLPQVKHPFSANAVMYVNLLPATVSEYAAAKKKLQFDATQHLTTAILSKLEVTGVVAQTQPSSIERKVS